MQDALDVDQVALGPLAYTDLFVGSWDKLCEICPVQTEILTACNTTLRTRTEPDIPVHSTYPSPWIVPSFVSVLSIRRGVCCDIECVDICHSHTRLGYSYP